MITNARTVLLRGGTVYSPADPFATAMLVDGDTVAWVGQEGAADGYAPDVNEVIHLDGALVTPAFVDAHVHLSATGLAMSGLDLSACRSLSAALGAVETAARRTRGGILLGTGWDETAWPERRAPQRGELDRASYGGVVMLERVDGHSSVVSSALLAAAPELRAVAGDAPLTGDAHHLARRVAREAITLVQRKEAALTALRRATSLGIGMVHEMGGPEIAGEDDFRQVLGLGDDESLPEIVGYWGELGAIEKAREFGARGAGGDLFADGSLGSHTAALSEPYADADHQGSAYLTVDQIAEHVSACSRAGLQAGFHAIGDAAVRTVLAGHEKAGEGSAIRLRIEHAELLDADAIERLSRLGIVASVQPGFDARWGGERGMYAARLGPGRAAAMNPFAALVAAGVPVAFGSDAPVTPLDPWGSVRAAAYHQTPEHRLTVRAAFTAHTRGGWRAAGEDGGGVLAPGAPASYAVWRAGELVVQTPDDRVAAWSTDPRSGVPGLPDVAPGADLPMCLQTVVRGRLVYSLEGAPQ